MQTFLLWDACDLRCIFFPLCFLHFNGQASGLERGMRRNDWEGKMTRAKNMWRLDEMRTKEMSLKKTRREVMGRKKSSRWKTSISETNPISAGVNVHTEATRDIRTIWSLFNILPELWQKLFKSGSFILFTFFTIYRLKSMQTAQCVGFEKKKNWMSYTKNSCRMSYTKAKNGL